MTGLAVAALVGFVLRGVVTSAVLRYVWRRDGRCPECRTPGDGPGSW